MSSVFVSCKHTISYEFRVNSTARLFADDCLLYRVIKSTDDHHTLQQDLDLLQQWENEWQSFYPEKCEVFRITNKRRIIDGSYSIQGHILQFTDQAKHLGVTIDTKLSWGHGTNSMTEKAKKKKTTPLLSLGGICHPAPARSEPPVTKAWSMHQPFGININAVEVV